MQSIEETRRSDGIFQKLKTVTVGREGPGLRQRFDKLRNEVEQRIESGETESATIVEHRRIGRNDACPCGSGVKFKKCCGKRLSENDERIAS